MHLDTDMRAEFCFHTFVNLLGHTLLGREFVREYLKYVCKLVKLYSAGTRVRRGCVQT